MPAEDIRIAIILIAVGKRWIVERIRACGFRGDGRGFERRRPQRRVQLPSRREHAFERRAQGRKPGPRCNVLWLASRRLGMRVLHLAPGVANAKGYGERSDAREQAKCHRIRTPTLNKL